MDSLKDHKLDLEKLCRNRDTEVDCLILYYAGHGFENDFLIDSNGKIFSFNEIKSMFDERNCDELKNHPKIYLHDGCRSLKKIL